MSNKVLAVGTYQTVIKKLFKLDGKAAMNTPVIHDTHSIHTGVKVYRVTKVDGKFVLQLDF